MYLGGPNRTYHDVLKEMRDVIKTLNFSYMLSLVEELQVHGNRKEASLHDQKDLKYIREQIKEAKAELVELKAEVDSNQKLLSILNKK